MPTREGWHGERGERHLGPSHEKQQDGRGALLSHHEIGSYAGMKPLGSLQVIDRDSDRLVDCGPKTCPQSNQSSASH